MENKKYKVILIDDELKQLSYKDLTDDIMETLGDETCDDFIALWRFAIENDKTNDVAKLHGVARKNYMESDEFIRNVLFCDEINPYISNELKDEIANLIDQRELSRKSITIVQDVFNNESNFELTCLSERPHYRELTSYDLIIMDMMMDDNMGAEELAIYLGNVIKECDSEENNPLIMLISHRLELESRRLMFRQKAQISSAGFTIISKRDLIEPHFGCLGINLVWEQMLEQRKIAKKTRELCISWKSAFENAWSSFEEKLWNLDSASLQQIYFNTNKENDPFDEHIHELIGQYYISLVEEHPSVQKSLNDLSLAIADTEKENDIRYCQHYSGQDIISIQSILSSQYIRKLPSTKQLYNIELNDITSKDVNRILPFGIILSKNNEFPLEGEVLINLTQQCDLSKKDIFDRNISLLFTKAHITRTPLGSKNSDKEIPLYIDKNEWFLYINTSSLSSIPAKEYISKLKDENYYSHIRMRAEAAREIRGLIFNQLSRVADIRKTTSNKFKGKALIRYSIDGGKSQSETFEDDIEIVSFNDHYTIIGPDNISLSLWARDRLENNNIDIEEKSLSDKLRSCLKNKNEVIMEKMKIKLILTEDINKSLRGYNEKDIPGEGKLIIFVNNCHL